MILDWFNAAEAEAFAREVASNIHRLYPLTPEPPKPSSVKKDRKRLDNLLARIHTFAGQHKLNVYKKAKFLNTVKWELKDAGYENLFIDELIAVLARTLN